MNFFADKPRYKSRTYTPRVVRDAVSKEIDKWLKENERRRNNGMRKQCLKCKDIHRQLLENGLNVSYSSVCKYVRKKKDSKSPRPKDVYLRIRREPGEECEFDWGEVKMFLGKKKVTFYKFQWRFCNARAGWEKGNVERSVDYIRGRAFMTCVDFDTIEVAQQCLDSHIESERLKNC